MNIEVSLVWKKLGVGQTMATSSALKEKIKKNMLSSKFCSSYHLIGLRIFLFICQANRSARGERKESRIGNGDSVVPILCTRRGDRKESRVGNGGCNILDKIPPVLSAKRSDRKESRTLNGATHIADNISPADSSRKSTQILVHDSCAQNFQKHFLHAIRTRFKNITEIFK